MKNCHVCPRKCGKDRHAGETGFCGLDDRLHLASVEAHHGEEPCLSGRFGVANFFFSGCNLACVFCQNSQISQERVRDRVISSREFADMAMSFQEQGAHFVGLVTPSPQVPRIREALLAAQEAGCTLPVIYNSSAYDSLDQIKTLDGLVDVYLPDLKYADDRMAEKYSQVSDYVSVSQEVVLEMYRQVGDIRLDPDTGLAQGGMWVRHLVLPDNIAGTWEVLCFLALEVSVRVGLSIMSQYAPRYRAREFPELSRTLLPAEYEKALSMARELGFKTILSQDLASSPDNAVPDFTDPLCPFPGF